MSPCFAKVNTTMKKVVGMHRMGRGPEQASSGDLPPLGVGIDLHREIMRRINNRYFDAKDLCSMRRGGPGLAELAGVIPLVEGLGSEAITVYAGHLEKVISTRGHCERCEAKVYAILFLVVKATDPAKAARYKRMVLRLKAALGVAGQHRDFLAEVQEEADQESRRMTERDARHGRIVPAWQE